MTKSTLTIMLALVLLFVAAILAFPKFQDPAKISKKNSTSLTIKSSGKSKASAENKDDDGYIDVSFGLKASFDEEKPGLAIQGQN